MSPFSLPYNQFKINLYSWIVVPVAQWIARRTSNPEAVGSSPTGDVHAFRMNVDGREFCEIDMYIC